MEPGLVLVHRVQDCLQELSCVNYMDSYWLVSLVIQEAEQIKFVFLTSDHISLEF
jgi:hypothetical protein